MFDTTKLTLEKLLEQVDDGVIQLPEFQRDYVWSEEAVVSLLASIAKGYPVGALLMLERGGEVDFQPRPIEGTEVSGKVPDLLLLDGQQRMTSLYQVLWSERPVLVKDSKGQRVARHFFLDMRKAVSDGAAFEDAVEIVPAEKRRMGSFGREIAFDVSTPEAQYGQHMFPLDRLFDEDDWMYGWRDHWRGKEDVHELDKRFKQTVLKRVQNYEMPIIRLAKDNGREAVCTIFEKVNVGGVKLDAFELVTAIYAGSSFDLRRDWAGTKSEHGRIGRIRAASPGPNGVNVNLSSLEFLQACTILHTREVREAAQKSGRSGLDLPPVSCKRETLLALPMAAYKRHADAVERGFIEGAMFLAEQKVVFANDVPYPPQVVALAALHAVAKAKLKSVEARAALARWFWSGVLGEQYGSATETKIARDVPDLEAWLDGGSEPRTMLDALFQTARLQRLRTRGSAAYKGLHALLMRQGCRDFVSGKPVELMTVWGNPLDIHHIFPRAWCEQRSISPEIYNSIINKTALSAETNRAIGGSAPSAYLKTIEKKYSISSEVLDDILRSHLIDPAHLRNDDFYAFLAAREMRLANLAAEAMGKAIVGAEPSAVLDDDVTLDEEVDLDAFARL